MGSVSCGGHDGIPEPTPSLQSQMPTSVGSSFKPFLETSCHGQPVGTSIEEGLAEKLFPELVKNASVSVAAPVSIQTVKGSLEQPISSTAATHKGKHESAIQQCGLQAGGFSTLKIWECTKPTSMLPDCCASVLPPGLFQREVDMESAEEILDASILKKTHGAREETHTPGSSVSTAATKNDGNQLQSKENREPAESEQWKRPLAMGILMILTIIASAFAQGWLDDCLDCGPSLVSTMRYGSIPLIAAVIGYGTNVVALQMMFYPIEFIGFFPHLRLPLKSIGLDLPLFGWQGVIPMKAKDMAEISVDLMTQKLIKVEEVFSMLEPSEVATELRDMLPDVVTKVINDAGRTHCPKLWEHMPVKVRSQFEQQVIDEAPQMMANFIKDLQKNIPDVFDLKDCAVSLLTKNPEIMNEMFMTCGAKEFEFIRVSGFYLGFFFGLVQMIVWMFVREWWILPICGVFVGYFTNVIALKVIFVPVEPRKVCGHRVQGLFLLRQDAVSELYGKMSAEKIMSAENLMHALVNGPRSEAMFQLVDKHVAKCMEDQAAYYKNLFLLSIGAETWIEFRQGVCSEFRKRLPALLARITGYTQRKLKLEETLTKKLKALPPLEFERLLHAVFEQDEIKLILVGAVLGALVGFLQAVAQTPEQLGISF